MITNYLTIMMKHFEQMNMEVAAAAEVQLDETRINNQEDIFDCNRILLIKEGSGILYIQNEAIPLFKGVTCVILSGLPHRISVENGHGIKLIWCHFRFSFEDRDLYRTLKIPSHIHLKEELGTVLHFERIIEQLTKGSQTSKLRIKASMLEIISDFLESLPIEAYDGAPSEDLQKINIILKYIDDHIANTITVENMAKQIYLHPNYFIVFFKGILGYSPIQYVNLRRMEIAKSLLLKPGCNVSAAAKRVGMQIYYFSRMFKAHTGVTPSRYRKQATSLPSTGHHRTIGEE